MIKPSHVALWLCSVRVALLLICAVATAPLHAQQPVAAGRVGSSNPAVATDGATLIHGNYCGAGNRPGKPPIDALDLACMNHDACTPTGGVPTCECNIRLRDEAAAVAMDPKQAPELRSLASLTSAAATVMICNPMKIDAAVPPAAVAPVPAPPAAVSTSTAPPAAPAPAARPPAGVPPAAATAAPVAQVPVTAAPLSIVPESVAPVAPAAEAVGSEPVPSAAEPSAPAAAPSTTSEPRARALP